MRAAVISLVLIVLLDGHKFAESSIVDDPPIESCKKVNEIFSDCGNHPLQNTCADPDRFPENNSDETCYPGCICKTGYLRSHGDVCVAEKYCAGKCKGPFEVYEYCSDPCPASCKSVTSDEPQPQCLPPNPCPVGCNCLQGFVRNEEDVCVEAVSCSCDDPNAEVVACPNPCPGGTCESPEFSICKINCKSFGCQCKTGYVKNAAGKCTPHTECPAKCAGPNEVNVECKNPCPATCKSIAGDEPAQACLPSDQCSAGCDCISGFVRNSENICVEAETCGCPDSNAEVVQCPNPCPGGNCLSPTFLNCKRACIKNGCQCKSGFVKGPNENCVPVEECPTICKPNEKWNPCPTYCSFDSSCPILIHAIHPSCPPPPEHYRCTPRCECLEGFVRTNGECVPDSTCCEDPNSELTKCPMPCHETCSSKQNATCESQECYYKGCKCRDGFVKDASDKCIARESCPPSEGSGA